MQSFPLDSVKDAFSIFSNGEDVLVAGKSLWLFRRDGSFVSKFKTIRFPRKAAFLPNRTAIVDGYGDKAYHYLSLDQGDILWSSVKKGRRMMESDRFAVSPDGKTVYDVCYLQNQSMQVNRICPQSQFHQISDIKECLRVTEDIFCDQKGVLCALQTHLIIDPNDIYSENSPSIRQHGILSIPYENGKPKPSWRSQWQSKSEDDGHGFARGCDRTHILYEDFTVLDLDRQVTFPLLSSEERASLPKDGFTWAFDSVNNLLTIFYTAAKCNLIIDCGSKKVVARYDRCDPSVGYKGCLIGNRFWMGTENGIVQRPFPNVDRQA